MMVEDTQRLKVAAKRIANELERAGILQRPWDEHGEALETDTDGYYVKILAPSPSRPGIELWLDRWLPEGRQSFWFGFWVPYSRNDNLVLLQDGLPTELQACQRITDSDLVDDEPPLNASSLRAPVFETYKSSGYSYFGMYDTSSRAIQATRAASFLIGVLGNLRKGDVSRNYAAMEGMEHFRIERRLRRDPKLAQLCKQRDGYQCQVCEMRLEETYGPIGKDFAEAHHIVPLNKLIGPTMQSTDHLKTVCPNCHRMLHRMDGKAGDLKKLRKIVMKSRSQA